MTRNRLEAFSDGVIAILITIMVLELRAPRGVTAAALQPLVPSFLSYVLSFVFLGIYWSNHHHMLHMVDRVNGKILWANLHLLFWLSLTPFVTAWMGENRAAPLPVAVYGCVLLLAAIAYTILQATIIALQGPGSRLRAAVQGDAKGKLSILAYALAIPLAFEDRWISITLYILVALMWLVPDRRIGSELKSAR
jgi:TMEM175 potassium channel family protein